MTEQEIRAMIRKAENITYEAQRGMIDHGVAAPLLVNRLTRAQELLTDALRAIRDEERGCA